MKSLVCILGMLQPLRGDSTQWYHNCACMHGGGAHAYLRQKPSTKYVTACGFTPFSDTVQIACLLIYSIDNSSVNICIQSCTFDVSYKSNSFLFNTIKNENDIRQHRKKNYDNAGIIQSRKYYMSRFGRKIQTLI